MFTFDDCVSQTRTLALQFWAKCRVLHSLANHVLKLGFFFFFFCVRLEHTGIIHEIMINNYN